jgi:hypothetical protein
LSGKDWWSSTRLSIGSIKNQTQYEYQQWSSNVTNRTAKSSASLVALDVPVASWKSIENMKLVAQRATGQYSKQN